MPVVLSTIMNYLTSTGTVDIATILESAGQLFNWCITQLGALFTFVAGNALALLPYLILFVGLIFGLFGRVFSK